MRTQSPTIVFGMNTMFAVRKFLPDTVAKMVQCGFRVVVLSPEGDAPSWPEVEFRQVALEREIAPFLDLRALWQIWRVFRAVRPTITDLSTPKMAFLGGLAAWLAGVPKRIYVLRGLRHETAKSWKRRLLIACEKIACATAHKVICISDSVRKAAVASGVVKEPKTLLMGERASEGIAILPPGKTNPADLRRDMGLPQHASVIGFVGRLTNDKGLPELVETFDRLRDEGRDVRLLIIGDFEAGDALSDPIRRRIQTDPEIHWLGYIENPRPYYEAMDVFVFPTHREGLPTVLLEAAAAGTPAVSTRVTGVVDVVFDDITGILVPAGNPAALADATGRLLDDPETAKKMGRAARRLVEQHFDNSVCLERLAGMLESLAGKSAGHALTGSS